MPEPAAAEAFSADERRALDPYFTDLDGPVFALRNLPEVVKAALFARYSRSPKSLRRLFLDEFLDAAGGGLGESSVGVRRSEQLFQKVLADYGDDPVQEYIHFYCLGVDGVFSDNPDTAITARTLFQFTPAACRSAVR